MPDILGKEVKITGRLLRVGRLDGDGFEFLEGDPQGFMNELKKSRSRVDIFSFMQRLPQTSPLYDYPMEWDNYAALEITTFDHWWNHQIGFKARNKAKQAGKKGVTLREVPFSGELVQGISEVYNESPVRQGKRFWHYGKDLQTVYREEATYLSRAIFIGAYLEEKLIGFVKVVVDETNTQASFMNIVSMIRHRDKAPTNALFAETVRACAQRNIPYLVYSRFAYGSKTRSSVSDFKERNGMHQIDIPRYYVPLTVFGKIALGLGLHRQLKSRLPEPLMAKLREWRASWYQRRLGVDVEV